MKLRDFLTEKGYKKYQDSLTYLSVLALDLQENNLDLIVDDDTTISSDALVTLLETLYYHREVEIGKAKHEED